MAYENVILSITILVFSVIILWVTSLSMIRDRNISEYLVFFILGIILIINSTFMAFSIFWGLPWVISESLIFLYLIWVLLEMRRFAR